MITPTLAALVARLHQRGRQLAAEGTLVGLALTAMTSVIV